MMTSPLLRRRFPLPFRSRSRNYYCYFSTTTTSDNSTNDVIMDHHHRLPFNKSSLGLENGFVRPILDSIRQLPEINNVWEASTTQSQDLVGQDHSSSSSSSLIIDPLKRGVDVFASFAIGGPEHMATQALLAEYQSRFSLYDDALETLNELDSHVSTSSSTTTIPPYGSDDMILAKSKVCWLKGDFQQSQKLCESIITQYDDYSEQFPSTNLHMASAMTGKALSQLAGMSSLNDAFAVRDYFRIAIKFLERHPPTSNILPKVVADLNYGVAEAYYGIYVEQMNDVEVPMDPALKAWFQGLHKINKDQKKKKGSISHHHHPHLLASSNLLQATMQSNLAWGVLNYEHDRSDRLKKASGYAKDALAIYDDNANNNTSRIPNNEGLCRVLSVIASCYHQAGNAVTAEGLFQSAIDKRKALLVQQPSHNNINPLHLLELRDAYAFYGDLLKEWDKREKDADNLHNQISDIDNIMLNDSWKGKPGILATCWFWTPGDFA